MPDTTPAESILGPITPICCTEPGCHWACHGVPDKYADSRARIVREHLAAEHAPTPEPSPTPAWSDGDPLMEAVASEVWEQCRTENSIVVDDPRNIAAVAVTVARQLLGATEPEPESGCAHCGSPGHTWDDCEAYTAAVAEETDEEREQREDREEAARLHAAGDHQYCDVTCETAMPTDAMRNFVIAKGYPGTAGALDELLRRAAAPPAPVDRAATPVSQAQVTMLSELTDDLNRRRDMATAAAGVQPPTTSEARTVLAAALDGMATLITTSSRDWGTYRVDAWLYAVLVGWDCEEDTHDKTCVHGALEEMQQAHGWDDAAVAKARRYRAAVRALATPPAAPAAPEEPTR
ncbi:hypothetical protein OG402_40975 [Streptomyces anulatus]|uniref:hypothetical protein n=1 Tax=Streptomyces anulatus TaxID=1892 RepID=UPI002258ADEC|nr:hypothetical protein [Streptomyces anulatus]MCX4606802.1 hypothetical protein [Streptomyces anulatus]